jgi:hypothetical protein
VTWLLSLPARIKGALVAAVVGILALAATYRAGKRDGRQGASERDHRQADKIRERADDARERSSSDLRDVDERLRDHDRLRDG